MEGARRLGSAHRPLAFLDCLGSSSSMNAGIAEASELSWLRLLSGPGPDDSVLGRALRHP